MIRRTVIYGSCSIDQMQWKCLTFQNFIGGVNGRQDVLAIACCGSTIESLLSVCTPSLLRPTSRTEGPETAWCTEFVVAQFSHFAYS